MRRDEWQERRGLESRGEQNRREESNNDGDSAERVREKDGARSLRFIDRHLDHPQSWHAPTRHSHVGTQHSHLYLHIATHARMETFT